MKKKYKLEVYSLTVADEHWLESVQWRWRITSSNGRIVAASSARFASKQSAKRNLHTTLRALGEVLSADITYVIPF